MADKLVIKEWSLVSGEGRSVERALMLQECASLAQLISHRADRLALRQSDPVKREWYATKSDHYRKQAEELMAKTLVVLAQAETVGVS